MPVPKAAPESDKPVGLDDAARIARSLNGGMAHQLRSIIDRNLSASHGWSDMRINNALQDRGLVAYTLAEDSYHRGGGHWRTRLVVTDVKPTRHAERVWQVYEALSNGGDLKARPLGDAQDHVLRTLAERNNGRWWPGCGWACTNRSATMRILQSLADRGLAERGATVAGDPMFTVTASGRIRATPLVMRVARVIEARRGQGEQKAGGEQ